MRKLFAAVGCLLIFGAGWCFGIQQTAKPLPGGTTWNVIPQPERQFYVVGFMHGYVLGYRDTGAVAVAEWAKDKIPSLTPAQKKDMDEGVEEYRKAHRAFGLHLSALIFESAMSSFYSNEQNSTVCWDKAFMLSAELLAGNEPTQQELDAARKAGTEGGCNGGGILSK